ncbi:uncharacterized protein [Scyliorhinus torazame]|uniref:uncharacterized protein isoform X5 n=1 Tax=Scyliorhinus torazame TaxID=75743 RepID=UPI003B5B4F5A
MSMPPPSQTSSAICVDDCVPKKAARTFPNWKPWLNREIDSLLKDRSELFKTDDPDLYKKSRGLTEMPDLSRYKMLKYLWVNYNKIKHLDFLRLNIHLKELYLNSNLISEITGALKNLASLQILMLQNNWLHGVAKVVAEIKKLSWLHTLSQKISIYEQKDVLKLGNKATKDPSKNVVDSRIRRRSIMQFSTLDWNKVPNAQQKRLGDEPLLSSQIITTQFR